MSEKQKKLAEEILNSSYEMSDSLQQRFIGVAYGLELAQGLGMVPGPAEKEKKDAE